MHALRTPDQHVHPPPAPRNRRNGTDAAAPLSLTEMSRAAAEVLNVATLGCSAHTPCPCLGRLMHRPCFLSLATKPPPPASSYRLVLNF